MKIIVAVNDWTHSREMIAQLVKRRWHQDSFFKVLTVLPPLNSHVSPTDCSTNLGLSGEARAQLKEKAERMCAALAKQIEEGIEYSIVHFEVREGSPKREIIASAREWGADKILLGGDTSPSFITKSTETIFTR